jgi:hypothetical protein
MSNENADVQEKRVDNYAQFDQGYIDGYVEGHDHGTKPLPDWFATKTLKMLTARERGFFVGYQDFLRDMGDHA